MGARTRKFVGLILLVTVLGVYIAAGIILAPFIVPKGSAAWEMMYYMIVGMGWAVPAGFIISWIQKPTNQRRDA